MKTKILIPLLLVLSLTLLVLSGCGGEGGSSGENFGKAVFAVSDAAADMGEVTEVTVTIDSLKIHAEGGAWKTVSSQAQSFNLLELRSKGTAQLLAEAKVEVGNYDQIELNVSKVVVVDGKGEHEAKLPSNKILIHGNFDVATNAVATANFDFLADQSLHLTGEGRYVLAPVIKMETRAQATAMVKTNKEVIFNGGQVTTDITVGMNTEGLVDSGLRISPDAVLSLAASGKVSQNRGQALVTGTIKSVDTANGTVTIVTKSGTDLTLHLFSDSAITVKGSSSTASQLNGKVGAEIIAEYNAETKAAKEVAAEADAKTKAEVGATLEISGTIKSVNSAAGTVTVVSDSGAEVVLKVASDSKLTLGGVSSSLLDLASKVGARVTTEYNASSGTAMEVLGQSEAMVNVNGTIKAVDASAGTVTITSPSGDVVLKMALDSKVMINGTMATAATLKSMVGSEVALDYSQQSSVVGSLNAKSKVEQSTMVTGKIKVVNADRGTLIITTDAGSDVELKVGSSSSVVTDGSISTLANLSGKIGSAITAEYDAQTNAATVVHVQARATVIVNGTLKVVNTAEGTMTVATQSSGDIVVKLVSDTKITVGAAASTAAGLAASIGSQVVVEYEASTKVSTRVNAEAGATIQTTATGTIKMLNALTGAITIAAQNGSEMALKLTSDTKITVNGAASTALIAAAKIGSQATVQYNAQTNVTSSIDIKD
ncbi:MAG: DUF4382 domain-containing protein [SAR202 cluster bacterium]|nr:DUF4382 domain-containing protein [SAR202 cluster bacterium]